MIALDHTTPGSGIVARAQRLLGAPAPMDVLALAVLVAVGLVLTAGVTAPVAIVLIVVAASASIAAPAAACAAALAAIPLVLRPVAIASARFSLLELAIVLGALGLGVHLLLAMRQAGGISVLGGLLRPLPALILPALVILAATASLLTVADPRHMAESLRDYRLVIVEPVILLALARWTLRRGGERLLLTSLIVAAAIVAAVAVVQLLTGIGSIEADAARRATGPYLHPNHLALYLERMTVLAGAMALIDQRIRRYLIPVVALLGAGLASTVSRGGFLAAVAGGATIIWLIRSRGAWRWLMVATVAAVAGFAMLAEGRLTATGSDGSSSSRELIWSASLRMIRDHPVFGVGLDQFLYQYRPRYVDPAGWAERYTSHPHNVVLDFWLRLGLAGLITLGAFVGALGWALVRIRNAPARTGGVAVGAAAALTGGVVHGLVDNSFFLPDLAALTWLCVALIEHHLASEPGTRRTATPGIGSAAPDDGATP